MQHEIVIEGLHDFDAERDDFPCDVECTKYCRLNCNNVIKNNIYRKTRAEENRRGQLRSMQSLKKLADYSETAFLKLKLISTDRKLFWVNHMEPADFRVTPCLFILKSQSDLLQHLMNISYLPDERKEKIC